MFREFLHSRLENSDGLRIPAQAPQRASQSQVSSRAVFAREPARKRLLVIADGIALEPIVNPGALVIHPRVVRKFGDEPEEDRASRREIVRET